MNQGQWFYNLNALVLGALAVVTVAVILALRRRRPWDAALFALAPALLLTATVNWDLLAIGLAALGLLAWARSGPVPKGTPLVALSGVLLGLGGAAKMWPLFILGPILVLALRANRIRAALLSIGTAAATVVLVNLPAAIPYRDNWDRFFELNTTRPIDWARSGTSVATWTGSSATRPASGPSSGSTPTSRRSTTCRTPCSGWPASASVRWRCWHRAAPDSPNSPSWWSPPS